MPTKNQSYYFEIINDSMPQCRIAVDDNNQIVVTLSSDDPKSTWIMHPLRDGLVRIHNLSIGAGKALSAFMLGKKIHLDMEPTEDGNSSQEWELRSYEQGDVNKGVRFVSVGLQEEASETMVIELDGTGTEENIAYSIIMERDIDQKTSQNWTLDYAQITQEGNIYELFASAKPGLFLRGELLSLAGRGKLRVTYNWVNSSLNCDPNDDSTFLWNFIKTPSGQLLLSPSEPYNGYRLYANVNGESELGLHLQDDKSNWNTTVTRNGAFDVLGTGLFSIALRAYNDKYVELRYIPISDGQHTGFRLHAIGSNLSERAVFTVTNLTLIEPELQPLESYTVQEEDIRAVLNAYGLTLTDSEVIQLKASFPVITPQLIENITPEMKRVISGGVTNYTIGSVVGAILGAAIGTLLFPGGGTFAGYAVGYSLGLGTAGGLAIGAMAGGNIGWAATEYEPHNDPSNVINSSIPSVNVTMIEYNPVGGPYINNHIWEDIMRLTKFPQIGDPGLPDAGCLMPPNGGVGQVWYPASEKVGDFIFDEDKYPLTQIGNPYKSEEVLLCHLAIFVIVKLPNGKYQLRLHPDFPLVHTIDRPNHSQLTQGSRFFGLFPKGFARDGRMDVYAAGELYYDKNGIIKQISPKTGHYVAQTSDFDANVLATTKLHLTGLGYDTSKIIFKEGVF